MDKKTIDSLISLNTEFYKCVEADFDSTRHFPWSGWRRVGEIIKSHYKTKPLDYLDLACGNGRFAAYLKDNEFPLISYLGVDNSNYLLAKAREQKFCESYKFEYTNLLNNDRYKNLYDVIVSFGFMHHIPSHKRRVEFINSQLNHLRKGGLLVLTLWSRFNRKSFKNYDDLSDNAKSLFPKFEQGDYFLGWDKLPKIERYCHLFEKLEIESMIQEIQSAKLIELFRSDGKAFPDNFYLILEKT